MMKASEGKMMIAEELGDFLRRERELRHISLDDVAERTKISRRFLEAIEEGHYERLPGETFVRGFIRSYAKSVGLDPEDTLLVYSQTRGMQETLPPRSERTPLPRQTRKDRSLLWLLTVGLVVAGGVLFAIITLLGGPTALRPTSSFRAAGPDGFTANVPLVLTAAADSDTWLRVIIDDKEQHDTLLRAGQSIKWMGHERFVVSIGNAHAIHLQLNGRAVAFAPPPQSVLRHYAISREMLQ